MSCQTLFLLLSTIISQIKYTKGYFTNIKTWKIREVIKINNTKFKDRSEKNKLDWSSFRSSLRFSLLFHLLISNPSIYFKHQSIYSIFHLWNSSFNHSYRSVLFNKPLLSCRSCISLQRPTASTNCSAVSRCIWPSLRISVIYCHKTHKLLSGAIWQKTRV